MNDVMCGCVDAGALCMWVGSVLCVRRWEVVLCVSVWMLVCFNCAYCWCVCSVLCEFLV